MKSWKFFIACMGLSGSLIALPGQADAAAVNYHKHDHSERFEKFWMTLEEKLELRKDQKEDLKKHRESVKKEKKQLKEDSKKLHKQIKKALKSGADQSTLGNLGAQWGQVQVKRMEMAHKYQKKFKEVLDEEQKAKLEEFKDKHRDEWKKKIGDSDDE
ncbi:Spy/CpxP family protein refolding chaperone [Microbulbifer halophilus]|uniref:Spy/CpxP family protein refolding chaperone n=1 Tax=Microbulbifer halophilus TaxID=453963 RepID=A0ABW5EHH6_9GAMM|nr:Spy/CpxP family protein refolding chaperone [Microbulbifer halophilus]MCW8128548.1 Spy/CpxP family protein refolding chaperone [Microbulbifer halophilus]